MVNLAITIQTHFVDDYVIALAKTLCAGVAVVDLAIDCDIPAALETRLNAELPAGVWRRSRPVTWCGPSQVLAALDAMRALMASEQSWDYAINLSGDTLLVRPLGELHAALDADLVNDSIGHVTTWQLKKPPIIVHGSPDTPVALLKGAYRNLFSVSEDLRPFFEDAITPLKHASSRFFIACEERDDAKGLIVRAFDDEALARRLDIWRSITPRCARAYQVLHRSLCADFLEGVAGPHRELFEMFVSSFEPDETCIPTLLGVMGVDLDLPERHNDLHFGGGMKFNLDRVDLDEVIASGAFFARKIGKDRAKYIEALGRLTKA